jgi:ABC-type uncharacterized transport system permease subunit
LPAVGTVVLPVAAVASLLPALIVNVHRFNYSGDTLAAVHVAIALGAYAMFLVAALQALVLMGLEKRLRRRMLEPEATAVPPLLTLERFLFRLIAVGFLLLTLTLASGCSSRAALRQAARVQSQERVLGARAGSRSARS